MKVPTSFADHFAFIFSQRASRVLFLAVSGVFTMLAILLTGTAGSAQTAAERIAVGPIASVPSPGQVQAMKLLAPGVGWVLQQNRLYLTRNNGQDWVDITPYTSTQRIENVFFLNSSSGWVIALDQHPAGRSGPALQIASTSDAGRNWTFTLIDTPGTTDLQNFASIRSMFFLDSKHGWIILRLQSSSNFSLGVLLSTDDGGLTWKERPSPPVAGSIRFLTSGEGWLAEGPSSDALWSTSDGGTSWERKTVSVPIDCGGCRVEYSLPTFEDRKNGFLSLIVHAADHPYSITYSTHDAGKSWQAGDLLEYDSPETQSSVGSHMIRAFSSNDRTLTVQYDKDSVRTTIPQTLSSGSPVWVEFADSQNGWIIWSTKNCLDTSSPCSRQQELLSTTDGGRTLTIITPLTASGTAGISKNIDSLTQRSASPAGLVSEQMGSGTSVANGSGIHDLAQSQSTGPVLNAMQKGFDMYSCINPTLMQSVWSNSSNPYRNIGVYVGGCDVHCVPPTGIDSCGSNVPVCTISNDGTECTYPPPSKVVKPVSTHLNPSDLNTVLVHWGMIPIWVGAQAPSPCGYPNSYWLIGNSPLSEGAAEADQAMARDNSLGIPGIIYYDMEYYVPGYAGCSAAVASFLQGWVNELQNHGYKAGIYINTSNRADFSSMSPMPDSIWVAAWGSNATTPPTTLSAHWINQYCDDGTVASGNSCPDAIQQGSNWIDPVVGAQVDEDMVNGYVVTAGTTQTLSANLTANPTIGSAPLTTNLTATVSGTASGPVNYSFWWNCTDSGTTVSSVEATCGSLSSSCSGTATGFKCDNQSQSSYSTSHSYSTAGTYTAKVIVEEGSAPPAESRTTLTVTAATTGSISLSNSGSISVTAGSSGSSTLTVTPSGGFSGTVSFTCSVNGSPTGLTCTSPSLYVSSTSSATSPLSVASTTSTPAGNYSATVTVSDTATDKVTATATVPITVTSSTKITPSVTVVATPASITTTQALSVAIAVSGGSGNPIPTGSVVLVAGTGSFNGNLVNGVATIPVPAGTFAAGTDQLTATYTPDTTSSSVYNSHTGTGSVTVSASSATVLVQPSSLNFYQIVVGTTTASQSVYVLNSGSSGIDRVTFAVSGVNANEFSVTNNCPAYGLNGGSQCNATVTFTPGGIGARSASLSVLCDNATPSPQAVPLSGIGVVNPTLLVTPSSSSISTNQAMTLTVTVSGSNGTPTGSLRLSGGGYALSNIPLNSGGAVINIPATSLTAGIDQLYVYYTPDVGSSSTYNQASGTTSVTVTASAKTTPTVTVVPTPASITTAQQLSVAVTVNATSGNPTPTGSVVLVAGTGSFNGNLVNGVATIPVPAGTFAAGTDQLMATYSPDSASSSIYTIASGTANVTVTAAAKTTPTVTVTPSASSITTAQALTVTVAVSGTPTPTGSVTLSGGGYTSAAASLTSGSTSINIPAGKLATGSDTLTASYTPDSGSSSTYNTATGTAPVAVTNPAKTTPTVTETPSASSITTVQALTVTIAVNGGSGNPTPTGSVTLAGGGYTSPATTLSSGSASINIPAGSLSTGSDNLAVSYTPDSSSSSTYNSASGSVTVTVTTPAKTTPTVAVTPSASSITTAQALTVTVAVSGGSGKPTPTGTVTLVGGGYTSAAATLSSSSSSATISAKSLTTGADTLTVSYTPDSASSSTYNSATGSNSVTVTAPAKTTPTVAVTLSASSITTAQALSVTVGVSGGTGNPTPTGSLTLTSGTYTSAAATLSSGSATINIPAGSLATGSDILTVSYTPDSNSSSTYNSATGSAPVAVTTPAKATPTVTVTPSASSITTAQSLTVTVAVNGGSGNPTPTGTVTLSGGYTSAATTLSSGTATINISAGSLATGTDTLTVSYTPDTASSSSYNSASGSTSVTVTTTVSSSFTVSGTAVSVAPGATTGNTSSISVTPNGGFTGSVTFTAAVTSSPSGAQYPPTLSFGSTSPVSITGVNPGTATLTISTTAATSAALVHPKRPGVPWYAAGGATLACFLLFGIPVRRRRWQTMLGMLVLLVSLTGGILACGGHSSNSSGGGTGNPGTTAGNYTITVTGTSGSTTATGIVALTVQ